MRDLIQEFIKILQDSSVDLNFVTNSISDIFMNLKTKFFFESNYKNQTMDYETKSKIYKMQREFMNKIFKEKLYHNKNNYTLIKNLPIEQFLSTKNSNFYINNHTLLKDTKIEKFISTNNQNQSLNKYLKDYLDLKNYADKIKKQKWY